MNYKRVTSQDVANAAGVSRTTVSIVLNNVSGIQISDETRKRVIETAEALGYVPDAAARALASRRSQIIGLILTRRPHHIASDGFLTQILDGLIVEVRKKGLRLLIDIVEPEHQKQAYLELVRAKHIDGVILSGPRFDDESLKALQDEGIPMVLMGQLPQGEYYSVDIDNRAASEEAVNHLVRLGHRHIACITNASPNYTAAADRLQGYRDAVENGGIPFNPDLVRYGDFSIQSGYQQMQDLLACEQVFSAAFVASDEVAMGAKAALREHGLKIPADIALVGFDDLPMAYYLDPPLTTIHVPALKLARKASRLLVDLLDNKQPEKKQIWLPAHLVVRQSCGADPGKSLHRKGAASD